MVPLAPGSDRNPRAFRAIPRIHWSVLPPSSRWWWTLLHRPPRCTSAPSPTIGDWLLVDAIVTWGNLRGNGWIFSSKTNIISVIWEGLKGYSTWNWCQGRSYGLWLNYKSSSLWMVAIYDDVWLMSNFGGQIRRRTRHADDGDGIGQNNL